MARALVAALILLLVGMGALALRKRFIASWFVDGRNGPAPSLPQAPAGAPGISRVAEVRVILIDGLGRAAAQLPVLARFCATGIDLEVDVGFPTVSLPVQAVLWTGLTQQQSGILYRLKQLPAPPLGSTPARVVGSVAVVEDFPYIAGSFGFGSVTSADLAAAGPALAGAAPLVFVHVLRVDKAGHKDGPSAASYGAAAAWADARLGEWLALAPPGSERRWFVLSDHGHGPGGGHGGASPGVRMVRGCIAGGIDAAKGEVHLVDVARALTDSLGLAPAPGAVGRPLGFARAHPAPGATLPAPRTVWLIVAFATIVAGLALAWRRRAFHWSWLWLPAAWLSVLAARGWPDLSNPAVYPPLGRDLMLAAGPGLLVLLGALLRLSGRTPDAMAAAAGSAVFPGLLAAVSARLACGVGAPPLDRLFTGPASALFVLAGAAAIVAGAWLAIACLVRYLRSRRTSASLV